MIVGLCLIIGLFRLQSQSVCWAVEQQENIFLLTSVNNYRPCEYTVKSIPYLSRVFCNEQASDNFKSHLPRLVIKPDSSDNNNLELVIQAKSTLTSCLDGSFLQSQGRIRRLIIEGSQLTSIAPACLDGLNKLEVLVIRNRMRPNEAKSKKTTDANLIGRLFSSKQKLGVLAHLENLKRLELKNLEMSGSLPEAAFRGFSQKLESIRLSGNELTGIDDRVFYQSSLGDSLTRLGLESQPNCPRIIRNAKRWATPLNQLVKLSLDGCQLGSRVNLIKLDLSESVNKRLLELSLQNCNLLDLPASGSPGLDLSLIGEQLRIIRLDGNPIREVEQGGRDNRLQGLLRFVQLNYLQMSNLLNAGLVSLPTILTTAQLSNSLPGLDSVKLEHSGLRHLSANSLSHQLKSLHLTANPLETVDPNWAIHTKQQYTRIQLEQLQLNEIRLSSVQIGSDQGAWYRALAPLANSLRVLGLIGCQITNEALKPVKQLTLAGVELGQVEIEKVKEGEEEQQQDNTDRSEYEVGMGLRLGLDQLQQLETLLLVRNQLTRIPKGAFEKLIRLRTLILHSNQLVSLAEMDQNDDNGLIMGSGEQQDSVEDESRLGQRNSPLEHLDLRKNELIGLDRCAKSLGFSVPLENLLPRTPKWLAVERYEKPPKDSSKSVDEIRNSRHKTNWIEENEWSSDGHNEETDQMWQGGLILRDNPFVCDCRLAWLRRYVNSMTKHIIRQYKSRLVVQSSTGSSGLPIGYQVYLKQAIDFQCKGNNALTGFNFLSLSPEDLDNCPDSKGRNDICLNDLKENSCSKEISDKVINLLSVDRYEEATQTIWLTVHLDQMVLAWQQDKSSKANKHNSIHRELIIATQVLEDRTNNLAPTNKNVQTRIVRQINSQISQALVETNTANHTTRLSWLKSQNRSDKLIRKTRSNQVLSQYAFQVVYWPTGLPETSISSDQVYYPTSTDTHVDTKDRQGKSKLTYSLAIRPVKGSTAYTICLCELNSKQQSQLVLVRRASACQAMQPFNHAAGLDPSNGAVLKDWTSLDRWLLTAGIGMAGIGLLLLACVLIICLYRSSQKKKRQRAVLNARLSDRNNAASGQYTIGSRVVMPTQPGFKWTDQSADLSRIRQSNDSYLPQPPPLPPQLPPSRPLFDRASQGYSVEEGVYTSCEDEMLNDTVYLEPNRSLLPLPLLPNQDNAANKETVANQPNRLTNSSDASRGRRSSGDGQEQCSWQSSRAESGLEGIDSKLKNLSKQFSLSQNDLLNRQAILGCPDNKFSNTVDLNRANMQRADDRENFDEPIAPSRNKLMRSWRKMKRLLTKRQEPPQIDNNNQPIPASPALHSRYPSTPNLPMPFHLMPRKDQLAARGLAPEEIEIYLQGGSLPNQDSRDVGKNYLHLGSSQTNEDDYLPMSSLNLKPRPASDTNNTYDEYLFSVKDRTNRDTNQTNQPYSNNGSQLKRRPSKSANLERVRGNIKFGDLYELNPYASSSEHSNLTRQQGRIERIGQKANQSGVVDAKRQGYSKPPVPKTRLSREIAQPDPTQSRKDKIYNDLLSSKKTLPQKPSHLSRPIAPTLSTASPGQSDLPFRLPPLMVKPNSTKPIDTPTYASGTTQADHWRETRFRKQKDTSQLENEQQI